MELSPYEPLPAWIDDLVWDANEGAWCQASLRGIQVPDDLRPMGPNDFSGMLLFPGIRPFDKANRFFIDRPEPPAARECGSFELFVWDAAAFRTTSGREHIVTRFESLPHGDELTAEFGRICQDAMLNRIETGRSPQSRANAAARRANATTANPIAQRERREAR